MNEYIATLEKLYAAVIADVLDALGRHNQTLSANISALTPAGRVCGRVFTGRAVVVEQIPPEPYKLEMQAIDVMQAGDVFVLDAPALAHAADASLATVPGTTGLRVAGPSLRRELGALRRVAEDPRLVSHILAVGGWLAVSVKE